jgi:hypothetical protein
MKAKAVSTELQGVVYRIACQNRGCGHRFDLRITPQNARLLSETMACPRCGRRGGFLKPEGRIGDKLFAARLFFKLANTNYASSTPNEELDTVAEVY